MKIWETGFFRRNYRSVDGIRLHYVDEGSGPPVLMVHGQPTSSYLYRKMIPPLVDAGYRVVAPDLMGFGLSDKPTDEKVYTLKRHVAQMTALVDNLGLEGVTTVGQDWGGPISLRYAIEHRENIRALVILNTLVRSIRKIPWSAGLFFFLFASGSFSSFLTRRLDLFRRLAFSRGFFRPLPPDVLAEYRRPHPTAALRAGIAAFPKMVPTTLDHPNAAYIDQIEETLRSWEVPVLVAFSDKDVLFRVREGRRIADMVPNGRFYRVRDAGHYLQEDAGEEIASRIVAFLRDEARIDPSTNP
ncbi:MAG: alpha/beta fold hydrolase [Thermoplasmata archaeon]